MNYRITHTDFDQVEVNYRPDSIWSPEDPEVEDNIQQVRQERIEAADENTELYNGALLRVIDAEVDDRVLHLDLENTTYFDHIGTRDEGYSMENRADALTVGTRLVTSDDYLVMGERSEMNDTGAGMVQTPAGYVEGPEQMYKYALNSNLSPIVEELDEELNIGPDSVVGPDISHLQRAEADHPMLVYDTATPLDSWELTERWAGLDRKEFSGLVFVNEDELLNCIDGEPKYTYMDDNVVVKRQGQLPTTGHTEAMIDQLLS